MIGEIITIGSELVTGRTMDTNSSYLSNKLLDLGIDVYYHTSVDDNSERLEDVIKTALNRADLIITSGGLGPTQDDITKEIIAKALDLEMIDDMDMREHIDELFKKSKRVPTSNNYRQAFKLKGSKFINNSTGTAPGIYLEKDEKIIIMLPGPPWELKNMFEEEIEKLLRNDKNSILTYSINLIGLGESSIETKILDLNLDIKYTEIATFAKPGMVEIRLVSEGPDKKVLEDEIEYIKNIIDKELKDYIFGYGNIEIEEAVIELLRERELKLGLCESCTGGLLASKLVSIPGSSDILDRSLVTYSNKAKMEELNVSKDTLDKYGAVSEQTAYEMAKGLMDKTDLDIVVSITGIAGPESDNTNKPVGLVYICIMTRDDYQIVESNFYGTRNAIRERSAMKALEYIRKTIIL